MTDAAHEPGARRLRLVAREVTQLCFDHAVTLRLADGDDSLSFRIASPLALERDGARVDVVPEGGQNTGALLPLFGLVVVDASVDTGGALLLRFSAGVILRVEPDPAYEAWEATDSRGLRIVCTPGGELSVSGDAWADAAP